MAYSAQSFYRPGVMPDTQGLAPGIAGAGSAIAGALGTYAGWKQDDKVRADQQQFATQRDEARMGHESAMIDKRWDRDMELFGMQQDAQKQEREVERAMADEQLRAANLGMASYLAHSGYDPTALLAASKMDAKAQDQFLRSAMAQAGMELKARVETKAEIERRMAEEEMKPDPAPKWLPVQKPDGTPSSYGVPYDGKRLLGGAMPMNPKPDPVAPQRLASKQLKQIDMNGRPVTVLFDPNTGSVEQIEVPGQKEVKRTPADTGNLIRGVLDAMNPTPR